MTDNQLIDDKPIYEALVQTLDGTGDDVVDPVVSITINNGFYDYTFTPENLDRILIRKRI